jgi:peptide/nickel transport system permease protein
LAQDDSSSEAGGLMLLYALRRLIYLVPVAFGVSLLVFALVHLAPGDPISAIVPPDAPKEVVDKLKEYFGTAAAYAKSRVVDRLVTSISLVGVSVPHFWLAIVLVIIFSVELGMLPPMGIGPENATGWSLDWPHIKHMILPTIALSVIPLGVMTRTVRSTIKEILSMEFVTALQAKGMNDRHILFHVLKNAAPVCLAVMGLQAGNLIGGSILIETVFAWPGTGFLLNSAIFRRDLPILQGTTLVLAFFFMMLNLTVDVIQTLVDPRIKRG